MEGVTLAFNQPVRLAMTFQKGQRQNTKYLDICGTRTHFLLILDLT